MLNDIKNEKLTKNSCSCSPATQGKLAEIECKPKLKVFIEDASFEIDLKVLEETKVRSYLTVTVFAIAVILALTAAIYGYITGFYDGLIIVGLFVEAPVMSVLWYYYGKTHDNEED